MLPPSSVCRDRRHRQSADDDVLAEWDLFDQ